MGEIFPVGVGFCTCIFHLFPTHEWHCGNTYLSLLSNSKHPPHKFSPLISNKIPNWHVAGSAHLKSIPRSETEARTPALREVACYSVCGTSEDSCWKSLFSTARGGLSPSASFHVPFLFIVCPLARRDAFLVQLRVENVSKEKKAKRTNFRLQDLSPLCRAS